jgi:hypothetical protein
MIISNTRNEAFAPIFFARSALLKAPALPGRRPVPDVKAYLRWSKGATYLRRCCQALTKELSTLSSGELGPCLLLLVQSADDGIQLSNWSWGDGIHTCKSATHEKYMRIFNIAYQHDSHHCGQRKCRRVYRSAEDLEDMSRQDNHARVTSRNYLLEERLVARLALSVSEDSSRSRAWVAELHRAISTWLRQTN